MSDADTIKELRRQIGIQQDALAKKNRELDAMHYVWCDGGCRYGVNRFCDQEKITEEIVERAERNARRLRRWWNNRVFRERRNEFLRAAQP
jgi:hypothetical protein